MTGEDKCGGMCLDVGYVPVLDWGGGYTGMFTLWKSTLMHCMTWTSFCKCVTLHWEHTHKNKSKADDLKGGGAISPWEPGLEGTGQGTKGSAKFSTLSGPYCRRSNRNIFIFVTKEGVPGSNVTKKYDKKKNDQPHSNRANSFLFLPETFIARQEEKGKKIPRKTSVGSTNLKAM